MKFRMHSKLVTSSKIMKKHAKSNSKSNCNGLYEDCAGNFFDGFAKQ